jgi:hypothetical protein
VDEKRGLTALDALSTTYKKAAEIAAKSSKAALSLILVVAAFLGFNTLTGREGVTNIDSSNVASPTEKSKSADQNSQPAITSDVDPEVYIQLAAFQAGVNLISTQIQTLQEQVSIYNWAGLDSTGAPIGLTSNLGSQAIKYAQLIKFPNITDQSSSSIFKIDQNGLDLLLSQDLYYVDGQLAATILPISSNGPLAVDSSNTTVKVLLDGSKLVISSISLANTASSGQLPSSVNVRIKVSADGLEILAQSAQILFSGTTQTKTVI